MSIENPEIFQEKETPETGEIEVLQETIREINQCDSIVRIGEIQAELGLSDEDLERQTEYDKEDELSRIYEEEVIPALRDKKREILAEREESVKKADRERSSR